MVCPICGNEKLYRKDYSDDGYHVETCIRCDECEEFLDHWAYGRQVLVLGEKHWDFTDHPFIKGDDIEKAKKSWEEIELELVGCKYYDGCYSG